MKICFLLDPLVRIIPGIVDMDVLLRICWLFLQLTTDHLTILLPFAVGMQKKSLLLVKLFTVQLSVDTLPDSWARFHYILDRILHTVFYLG